MTRARFFRLLVAAHPARASLLCVGRAAWPFEAAGAASRRRRFGTPPSATIRGSFGRRDRD
ncbi:MAG: hypothetical protein ACLPKT_14840 [Methylocella sp.]